MVKLVRGQDNVISLHITSTYPVGEVSGTFVAKSVTIPVPQSRNGTEIKVAAADVEAIGEDFMIGVMTLKNEANEEVAVVRVPLAVLPEGSDNRGFTDVRITLVSIREVEGGDHGGAGVKMFPTKNDFPVQGNVRYIYLAEDTGKMYRWDEAAEDYVEVSGVVHANLAENNPEKDGYVLNRSTRNLVNEGWDGTHPYVSIANFVPDYASAKTYSKDEIVFHSWKVEEPDVYDNGIFKCLADGTTVAPPDASEWIEIDLKDLIGKEVVVTDKTGATPTGGEEIWIDEAEIPESQSYNDLVNKPQINGHELTGNKTSRQLGIVDTADLDKKLSKQRVDGDATKGQVEWEELDDHSGCLKVTGVVKGTKVETADGNHNLADKADKATTLAGYGITDAATQIEIAAKADLVDGKVPAAQLPSYVDDVLEYDSVSSFPSPGEAGKIYVAKDTNLTYRWSGTQYVEISQSLALGETESTAYPGDKGMVASETASTAYDVANNAAIAIVSHTENKSNPHAVTAEQTGAVPLVEDKERNKTAVTIGSRVSNEPVGKHSLVNGDTAAASGNYSHAEGFAKIASGDYSHAEGAGTTASGNYSHAEGTATTAFGDGSHAEGAITTASGPNSHAEGVSTTASGNGSHAEGANTIASGQYSHASGFEAQTREGDSYAYAWNGDNTIPAPYTSNGPGTFNINPVGGMYGFYIGEQTLDQVITAAISVKADYATTLAGYGITDAVPLVEDASEEKTAVTIGRRKDGERVGEYSFANGGNVTASGNLSHAEGGGTTASGACSHAEGVTTTASGDNSHSEGNDTTASGPDSHAEGTSTTASGISSHAEGGTTTASGDYSHAEGNGTTAFGPNSHAEGAGTKAAGPGSHAEGIWAETREEDKYAFAWNGDDTRISIGIPYPSHGPGTFNINPVGGLNGFWIGQKTFPQAVNAALAPEYFATSAYSVGAIVYYDGNIYQCKTAIADGGEPWNAEHWEIRKLDDFFTESNSLLTGTIEKKSIPAFSSSSTYEVGEIVIYDGVAYKCVTAITTAEEWTAAHWTPATNSDLAARLKGLKSDGTATDAFATSLLGKPVAKEAIDEEIIEKGTAPDAHLEAPTDEHLKLILAGGSVAYDSAKALPYKLTSVIGDRVVATMTLTAASTDITLPTISADDTTVKDFILDVTNAYAVEGVATDAGINIPRTDFKLVTRDGESLTDVTTVKAGKSAFICFTQKSPVVVDGTTYPCWCVIQLPFGDPS